MIVTADHAHTSQMTYVDGALPARHEPRHRPDRRRRAHPGRLRHVGDRDRRDDLGSQSHTGAEVPVWATGPQAANIQGTIDQTDIFGVLNGKTPSKFPGGGAPGDDGAPGPAGPRALPAGRLVRRCAGIGGRDRRPGFRGPGRP